MTGEAYRQRRCQVGLHNYMFHKNATTRDQTKELLICKECGDLLLPSLIESRQQYIHEDNNESDNQRTITDTADTDTSRTLYPLVT